MKARERLPLEASGKPLLLLQSQPGLGGFMAEELRNRLQKPVIISDHILPQKEDLIFFQTSSALDELLDLRTAEDVFVVAARIFHINSELLGLRQAYAGVSRSKDAGTALQAWITLNGRMPKPTRYRVVTRTTGRQAFTRKALGRAVADAIRDTWPGQWSLVEEDGDMEVWVTLLETELVVALRLSPAGMRQRDGRNIQRPAALRPAVAAAMIRMTNPSSTDVFLDPMAGTGTLIVERAEAGPCGRLIAGDRSRGAVAALTKNLQPVGGDLAIRRLDASDLPFQDGEISKIAVNLPFGRQINNPDELTMLYRGALREWARVVTPGGLIVALADDVELFRMLVDEVPRLRIRRQVPIAVLGHRATIFQIERF